jgi:hypothetical protein
MLASQMFLGNEEKVYILDKAEGNAATVKGHPAWGAVWLVSSRLSLCLILPETNFYCTFLLRRVSQKDGYSVFYHP